MWEQRNEIKHTTMHPRKLQELEEIRQRVARLYAEGSDELLVRDRILLSKSLAKIKEGSASKQEQWYTSVLLAHRRAASAKEDRFASLRAERRLMEIWLGITDEELASGGSGSRPDSSQKIGAKGGKRG
jgi:hypothetical protein